MAKQDACKRCGKSPDETKFYPSRKDRCAKCIAEITKENREKGEKTYSDAPESSVASEEAKMPSVSDESLYECQKCGEVFEKYRMGAVWVTSTCKSCVSAKISLTQAKNLKGPTAILIDLSEDKDLLAALQAMAKRERRSPENQAIILLEKALA